MRGQRNHRRYDRNDTPSCGPPGRSKWLRHPQAGLLTLDFETLHVPAAPGETGLVVHVFSADEGSQEAVALARLVTAVTEVPDA